MEVILQKQEQKETEEFLEVLKQFNQEEKREFKVFLQGAIFAKEAKSNKTA